VTAIDFTELSKAAEAKYRKNSEQRLKQAMNQRNEADQLFRPIMRMP
jgi:hypothetical protein